MTSGLLFHLMVSCSLRDVDDFRDVVSPNFVLLFRDVGDCRTVVTPDNVLLFKRCR